MAKRRVKLDNTILHFVIILTGFLYLFPQMYIKSLFFDDACDFVGILVVLAGTFMRMSGRGHKKVNSRKGHGLVLTGPYTVVRNPMYLGSFLMGAGFVLIVWPWWALPIFVYLFYLRFNRQIVKEEKHLTDLFKETYKNYCRKVPAMIPELRNLKNVDFREAFPYPELWITQEKYGFLGWPLLAVLLETFQEYVVYGFSSIGHTFEIIVAAMLAFALTLVALYNKK